MKKILLCLSLLLAVSCAKENTFDTSAFEKGAFARWMAKYHPDVPSLTGDDEGIYLQWLGKNPAGAALREGYWLEMDYTLRDQNGDIVYTRSPRDARLLFGTFLDHSIHYVPELVQYSPEEMTYKLTYPSGQIRALELMNEGDSVRLYLPPKWGYGSYGFTYSAASHYGYAPTDAVIASTTGLIIDMRLNRVIRDIDLYEREQVTRWAADSLGIFDPADSIALGVYMKKIVENPAGDSVKTSTAQVYYTTRFLDGHVLDTNVDSVALVHQIAAMDGPMDMSTTTVVAAAAAALQQMRSGERVRFVTVSDGAYGSEGKIDSSDSHLVVPPYTPLEFEFYVESVESDED